MNIPITTRSPTRADIEECLGPEAWTYAGNKNRGGGNDKKGNSYENFFLAAKAGEIAALHIGLPNARWPFLQRQTGGFVDDLQIATETETQFFQLKNSDSVSWRSGKHSIESDFLNQYKVAYHRRHPSPRTCLVVSDHHLKEKLEAELPNSIREHSEVHFFPYCNGSANRMVMENAHLRDVLRRLSKVENPTIPQLEAAFLVLMMACIRHEEGCCVDKILKYAGAVAPSQLRSLWGTPPPLRDDFVLTLASIPELRYDVIRGFFVWNALGTKGEFRHDCSSEAFKLFQATVCEKQPKTFDEFEELIP